MLRACLGRRPAALSRATGTALAPPRERRTTVQISAARLEEFVRAELTVFARKARHPLQPLKFLEILRASSSLAKVARLAHEELPVRFARRIKHIERVEGWDAIPELVSLHNMHVASFRELRLADPSDLRKYSETIFKIRQRHKSIAPLFAEAVKRIDEALISEPRVGEIAEQDGEGHLDRQAVEQWAETFLRSRVSTEMLMSHFMACTEVSQEGSASTSGSKYGIIDTECKPWDICQHAIAHVQEMQSQCVIEAENPSGSLSFCHAPRYLFYIMDELLQNSMRATMLAIKKGCDPASRPIRVAMCADDHQVVVRISDRGGGIASSRADQMWSCTFTTSLAATPDGVGLDALQAEHPEPAVSERPWGVFAGQSPISGRGIGLPLSRLYAMYLGGSLQLINMPGLGVDAYIFLNRIDPSELPAASSDTP
mmetsp:Transcript_42806/g.96660  ORF Transcript_42806/g.96660 Transcript_42806/m.96660 type:complete len:428 (-) Transcript_42806:75-1358(-)